MDSIGGIVALVGLAILIVGGGVAAQLALEQAAATQESVTETFDAGTVGSLVAFNQSHRPAVLYADSVNVTGPNGTQMIAGQDYDWHPTNGTLTVLDGDLVNDSNATIVYEYGIPSQPQQQTARQIAMLTRLGKWLPLVVAVALVILAMSALGGLT